MTEEKYNEIKKEIEKQLKFQKEFMNIIKEENQIQSETEKMTKEYFTETEKYY